MNRPDRSFRESHWEGRELNPPALIITGEIEEYEVWNTIWLINKQQTLVALYNVPDEPLRRIAEGIGHRVADLRVGPLSIHTGSVIGHMPTWSTVDPPRRQRDLEPAYFLGVYKSLVPYDGLSIASSLARTTPQRSAYLDWFATGSDKRSENVMQFAILLCLSHIPIVALVAGVMLLGMGWTQPGFALAEPLGNFGLLASVGLYLKLSTLRKKFGYYNV